MSKSNSKKAPIDENLKLGGLSESDERGLRWHSIPTTEFTISGLPWFQENRGRFWRFPKRAKKNLREAVWALSKFPAGGCIRWRSNSRKIAVRARIMDISWSSHMPASGSGGLELFGGEPLRLRSLRPLMPDQDSRSFESLLVSRNDEAWFDYQLQLPLYKELVKLDIGLEENAQIAPPSSFSCPKPVVFYGTSITQGACASTAGSDFVSTIGRRLNVETVNLGFSGNGKGEPEVAKLIAEIDAALFVIDYSNNSGKELSATLPTFLRILRDIHPLTPLLLQTTTGYPTYLHNASARNILDGRRDEMIRNYLICRDAGDRNVHLADAFYMLSPTEDGGTVDAGHPTSHGFQLLAQRLTPCIENLLFSML